MKFIHYIIILHNYAFTCSTKLLVQTFAVQQWGGGGGGEGGHIQSPYMACAA